MSTGICNSLDDVLMKKVGGGCDQIGDMGQGVGAGFRIGKDEQDDRDLHKVDDTWKYLDSEV